MCRYIGTTMHPALIPDKKRFRLRGFFLLASFAFWREYSSVRQQYRHINFAAVSKNFKRKDDDKI